ncbi:MAG: hypothetical protein Q8P41_28615 [Pseudomonadota bacterium]|nr:hypothetical protein [Pseudomonadota bacterium]
MLTPCGLGVLALLVLWQTTLLVAWATLREVAALRQRAVSGRRPLLSRVGWVLLCTGLLLCGAAACTALALTAPVFGTVSTVGGVACLAFFLLVQPLGTALRDYARADGVSPSLSPHR